jgi:hypothetical protein
MCRGREIWVHAILERGVSKLRINIGWLLAQDIDGHYRAERMSDQVHSPILCESWVVMAPQAIDAIRLLYTS